MSESRRSLVLLAAACALLAALPFFVVDIPPVTDLSQHLAQMRLLQEATHDAHSPYVIQWLTPYSLGYAPLAACWAVFPPLLAGRVALALLALVTTVAVHALARRRGRSPDAAVLATVLFFSHNLYWGFYSFMWGWPLFVLWLHLCARAPARREWLALAATGVALYFTHILWLAFALGYLGLWTLLARTPRRAVLLRAAACVPAAALALVWYARFRGTGFAGIPQVWGLAPYQRLYPQHLRDAMLGGLEGPSEGIVAALLLLWIVVGLGQARARWREAIDGPLVLAAAVMLLAYVVLPTKLMNTVFFNSRWMPPAATLLLLGLPAPTLRLRPVLLRAGALALVTVFCLSTALAWRLFEIEDLSGLQASLARLPERPKVLGLDYLLHSATVKGSPFVQTGAWAQVLHGGRLGFSFAEFPPSLVVFAPGWQPTVTPGLEWHAARVQPSDFMQFDYALIGAPPQLHERFATIPALEPLVEHGRWRLYRVRPEPPTR